MTQHYPIHVFVRRILMRRLILVALAVSVVLGVSTWFTMRDQVQDEVVETAFARLAIIKASYRQLVATGLAEKVAVVRAIDSLADLEFLDRKGRFAYAEFYDELGVFYVSGDSTLAVTAEAEKIVAKFQDKQPPLGEDRRRLVRLSSGPAVHVVVPIDDKDGKLVSWVSAVYPLNRETASRLVTEPLITVGMVVMVVLLVSGLFYPVVLRMANRLSEFSSDLLEANLEMMEVLGSAVAKRDSDTDDHNYRVTIYAVRLAEKLGLSDRAMQGLIKGAFLHDVGKIGIRDEVLLKPGKLTSTEFDVMKTHVNHGLDIVGRAGWLKDAQDIVGGHHEKFDGGGYPASMPGEMIPLAARIFAVTDVFDALSSVRPYKEAMPLDKVFGIMVEGRGSHFDPEVVDVFLELAPDLHAHLNGRSSAELRSEMQEIIRKYFNAGLETLLA